MTMQVWNSAMTTALVSHLLQSTAFAAVAWLVTLALRKYPARIRFIVWMIASFKFLVPFSLLTSLGAHWARPSDHPQVRVAVYTLIEELGRPFVPTPGYTGGHAAMPESPHFPVSILGLVAILWLCGCAVMLTRWTLHWINARRVVKDATLAREGREAFALRRAEAEMRSRRVIPIVMTSRAIEPGVFGMFRPVLLWPERLSEQLDDLQIDAIVAHELEHVRRRDNLVSAIQAFVEALFWFHPAVRWMGSQMSEERERACDERVIERSAQPEKYAQSILAVCAFCLESPLACVAGVSGSDLKKRILRIMSHRSGVALTIGRRALLGAAAVVALTLPIGFGMLRGQVEAGAKPGGSEATGVVPKYEVASIKPASSDEGRSLLHFTPDGTSIQGVPVHMLLRFAFGVEPDRIIGAPSWSTSNRYDIEAKVAAEDVPKLEKLKAEDRGAMLLPLLAERFNLRYHHETRELPMYLLVVSKGGSKLTESKDPTPSPSPNDAGPGRVPNGPLGLHGSMRMMPGRIESEGSTLDMLTHALSGPLGHTVIDKTGLIGKYDYTLQWTPDDAAMPMPGGPGGGPAGASGHESNVVEAGGPSLLTAVEEQLGLKIESTKGQVDVIVIDHLDLPSAN